MAKVLFGKYGIITGVKDDGFMRPPIIKDVIYGTRQDAIDAMENLYSKIDALETAFGAEFISDDDCVQNWYKCKYRDNGEIKTLEA